MNSFFQIVSTDGGQAYKYVDHKSKFCLDAGTNLKSGVWGG